MEAASASISARLSVRRTLSSCTTSLLTGTKQARCVSVLVSRMSVVMGSLQKVSGGAPAARRDLFPPGPRLKPAGSRALERQRPSTRPAAQGDVRWSRRVAPADSGQVSAANVLAGETQPKVGPRGDVKMARALTERLGRVET